MHVHYIDYSKMWSIEESFAYYRGPSFDPIKQRRTPPQLEALNEATKLAGITWGQSGEAFVTDTTEQRINNYLQVFQAAAREAGLDPRRITQQVEGREATSDITPAGETSLFKTTLSIPAEYVSQFTANGAFMTAVAAREEDLYRAGKSSIADTMAAFLETGVRVLPSGERPSPAAKIALGEAVFGPEIAHLLMVAVKLRIPDPG